MLPRATVIPFPGAERPTAPELEQLQHTLAEVVTAFRHQAALLVQVQEQIACLSATPIAPVVEVLTEREVQIVRLAAAGLANRQIADRLVITEATVKRHMTNILAKLEATDRTQAGYKARLLGII